MLSALLSYFLILHHATGFLIQSSNNHAGLQQSESNNAETEALCIRMHNNTAFLGVDPYAKIALLSARECCDLCINDYPNCVAVVFYYLHEQENNHVCYLFEKNSLNSDVALVPEKPMKVKDKIRSLEIVRDCHEFDPFPPVSENFASSSDKVPKAKREAGFQRPVLVTGQWTPWSQCASQEANQKRSQVCEYGRIVERRPCPPHMSSNYNMPHMLYIAIPYPPMPYVHPGYHTREYNQIMDSHQKYFADSCCYWNKFHDDYQGGYAQHPYFNHQMPKWFSCPCTQKLAQPATEVKVTEIPSLTTKAVKSAIGTQGVAVKPAIGAQGKAVKPAIGTQVWDKWSSWSICTVSCGTGVERRHRNREPTAYEGVSIEERPCEASEPCATWSEWTQWSICSATCDYGERYRSRYCILGKDQCEGEDYMREVCTVQPCSQWNEWQEWSHCSTTCDLGMKKRARTCDGEYCEGDDYEDSSCEIEKCFTWSNWQEWSQCSVSCGYGTTFRRRLCIGDVCDGDDMEENSCSAPACPTWSHWGTWSDCSATCDFGVKSRSRFCSGDFCPGERVEDEKCEMQPCTFWEQWQSWSQCSTSCGEGLRRRVRNCINDDCGEHHEEIQPCTINAECYYWSTWGEWSQCDQHCGPGKRLRHRSCLSHLGVLSDSCHDSPTEEAVCLEQPCCQFDKWSSWSSCSHECGNGKIIRTRECQQFSYDSSCNCGGHTIEEIPCNEFPCKQEDNQDSQEENHQEDHKEDHQEDHKEDHQEDHNEDHQEDHQQTQPKIFKPKSTHCHWTEWCAWSTCMRPCEGGSTERTRECIGDYGCLCYGPTYEQSDCRMLEQCDQSKHNRRYATPRRLN